jgi:hypothetical protein
MLIRISIVLIALVQSLVGTASSAIATTVIIDSFSSDGALARGRSVVSSVPDPDTIPGIRGERPGVAYAFVALEPIEVFRVDIGLSFIRGSRDILVSIHESEVQQFANVPLRVRTIPSVVLAQRLLTEVLPDNAAYVTWDLATPLLLHPEIEYFLSVTTVPGDEPSQFGWNQPSGYARPDTGFERAFQRPDRSWGSYQFNTFPRGAFRVKGWSVPEPSTAVLMILGLLGLSNRRLSSGST